MSVSSERFVDEARIFFCTAGQREQPGVNSFLTRDDEQLMARSEAHQNATASRCNGRGTKGGGNRCLLYECGGAEAAAAVQTNLSKLNS